MSRAGGAGRSLPPSGTTRMYSQPPMSRTSIISNRNPRSAHTLRKAGVRDLSAARLNGVHGTGAWLASRVQ